MLRTKCLTVAVMHLTPECSALIWPAVPCSSVAVRDWRWASRLQTDISPKFSCFCFLPWRTLACLPSLSSCLPLRARLHQRGRAINPALRRLPSNDTVNNSSLSTVHDESHPLVSSQNTPSIREAANLFLLLWRKGTFKKFERSSGAQNVHIRWCQQQFLWQPAWTGVGSYTVVHGLIIYRGGGGLCLARHIPNDFVEQHLWNTTQEQCLLLLILYQVRLICPFPHSLCFILSFCFSDSLYIWLNLLLLE